MSEERERAVALQKFGRILLGRNNLMGTDFADAKALRVERDFMQSKGGVFIQFSVSHHALGKVGSKEMIEALEKLLGEDGDP